MADEAEVLDKKEEGGTEVAATSKNPFSSDAWVDNTIEKAHEEKPKEEVAQHQEQKPKEDETVDSNVYLKETLGFENWESAKTEIAALREKAQTPAEIKFANEASQKYFEYIKDGKEDDLINFLNEKKRLDKLTSVEITDSTAAEIVKLGIYQKNKTLTPDEIDFVFNKKFSVPAKPVMTEDKTEDEYKQELSIWENKVAEVKKELVIEAKMAKPELDKFKTELILPDIQKGIDPKIAEEHQKVLEASAKQRNDFLQTLDKDFKNFNGYSVTYKDKDVEIPITYTVTDEEKIVQRDELKDFNVNEFLDERWFGKDGVSKINQIQEDLYFLKNRDKVLQKMVNDAGAKTKAAFIKSIRPVDVEGNTNKGTFEPKEGDIQTQRDALAKTMFAA